MDTSAHETPGIKEITSAAFDLVKMTSKPWMDIIEGSLQKSVLKPADAKESGTLWSATDAMKFWSFWQNGFSNHFNSQNALAQKLLNVFLEEQKFCSNLTTSWFTFARKTMEVIHNGGQLHTNPTEAMKTCQQLAVNYSGSCTDRLASHCARLLQTWGSGGPAKEKSEKTDTAKSRAQAEAKVGKVIPG